MAEIDEGTKSSPPHRPILPLAALQNKHQIKTVIFISTLNSVVGLIPDSHCYTPLWYLVKPVV